MTLAIRGIDFTLGREPVRRGHAGALHPGVLAPVVAAGALDYEKLIAEGQKLWRMGDFEKGVPACAGCHGPAGAGLPAQYPALAGQYAEYTEDQLKKFRAGERGNDPEKMMRMIAAKLSDQQMKAVAEYAAGLR